MAMFGSSWLDDEPIDDDRPMLGRNWLDETHFEYFINDEGEHQKIETRRELHDAIENNNRFTYDGKSYNVIEVLNQIVKTTHNDQDLGAKIRVLSTILEKQ